VRSLISPNGANKIADIGLLTASASSGISGDQVAWAYWLRWSGNLEMIQRAARAAVWAARDAGASEVQCRIDVAVRGDTESFDSPEDLRANLTGDALRRFEQISIAVVCTAPAIQISLAIVRLASSALPRGVLLEVATTGSVSRPRRSAIREAVIAAVNRSVHARGKTDRTTLKGDTECGQDCADSVHAYLHPVSRSEPTKWISAVFVAFVLGALLFGVLVIGQPSWFDGLFTERRFELDSSGALVRGSYELNENATIAGFTALLVIGQFLWHARHPQPMNPVPGVKTTGVNGLAVLARRGAGKVAGSALGALTTALLGVLFIKLGLKTAK
jgi:hypothetical protein